MTFKEHWGDIILNNSLTLYEIQIDESKLSILDRQLFNIYDKLFKINYNNFFNDKQLLSILGLLLTNVNTIKKIVDSDEDIKDYICDIIISTFYEFILLAEDYEMYEMCGNLEKIATLIVEHIKK
jgi:hypothetical protein